MTTIAIIPSRYGSTRFPGKPLALLCGKPVVQWVYEAASKVFDHVVVATDDARIQCAVAGFGGQAVITSQPHTCGTGRVAEAVEILRSQADIVVNIQGDEPLIQPEHLQALKQRIMLPDVQIATIAVPLAETVAYEEIADPNLVKVVLDDRHNALYFSRAVVPYVRGLSTADWPSANVYYAHAGVYAFKADTLAQISILPQSSLERAEKLEQLRWLQAGYSISCVTLDAPIVSIDTPDDLQKAESLLKLDKPDKTTPPMLDRTTPPPVYMMGDLTLPQPKTEKLINGITVHSFSGGTQDVCQISLVWRGGTSEISNPSVARIMASLLREGTTTMTGAQISEIIDFNGAMLKVISDGHYTYLNLSVLNSKIDAVLPVIYDIICHATMPESAFVTYREIEIKEYMLAHSKVMVLCQEAMSPLVKGKNHPEAYAKSPEEIAAITVDEVRDYYKRVFTADGCTAFVGGLLDHGVYESICKMLASLPSPHKAMDLNIVAYEPEAPETVELQMPEARQAAVCLTLPAPARSHPDYVPLRFTVIALGGYFGSRLMKNIREDKGYTYGIGSYLLGSREGSYIAISAQTDAKYVDLLIEEVRVELRKLVTDPLSDDELVRLRQYISSSLMENLDSPFSIIDYYRTIKCIDLPKGYFESQVDWVHRITADTVIEMAKRYIHPEMLRIAVVK